MRKGRGGQGRASLRLAVAAWFSLAWASAPAQQTPAVSEEDISQAEELMETAKAMGPWEQQYQFFSQATDNIFEQQGWTSEPDQFTRQLMHNVGAIPPWQVQKREEAFMNGIQTRLGLTHDQREQVAADVRREGMMLTFKHFKDVVPTFLEMARTRAQNEPFTAEQVQRWVVRLKPLLEESREAVERVAGRLEKSMTPEQRAVLRGDLAAFRRRHEDVQKLVAKWEAGQWTPQDWGLQHDPVHAGAMAREQFAAQRQAGGRAPPGAPEQAADANPAATFVSESEWDRYVKSFCATYGCDERQRTQAYAILQGSKKEAFAYRQARRDWIAQAERAGGKELEAALAPLGEIFNRMKKRLTDEVLTTQQRQRVKVELTSDPVARPGKPAVRATKP